MKGTSHDSKAQENANVLCQAISNDRKHSCLEKLAGECKSELLRICHWWRDNVVLPDGFAGEVTHAGEVKACAPRGIILATRLLWFYSEAALYLSVGEGRDIWRNTAQDLYRYIVSTFVDEKHGGVFWEVSASGRVINSRKQIYAQAFAVYAFSAYYRLMGDKKTLTLTLAIFSLIEEHGADRINGGYFEAFTQDWSALKDIRLSEKDLNSAKSMNTHLHILEAYTGLYAASHEDDVKCALIKLIHCYSKNFPFAGNRHLKMFMDLNWKDESEDYSYGHDIESSWLLWEAMLAVGDEALLNQGRHLVLQLVESCQQEGIEDDGSLIDAFSIRKQCKIEDRVWWVQAEAMVGFFNAYEITRDPSYLNVVNGLWQFLKEEIIDRQWGEWRWMSKADPKGKNYYTAGFWKGPYHNGRALIEISRRLKTIAPLD